MKRIGTVTWSKDYHFGQHNVGKVGIVVSYAYDIGYKIWWSDGQTSGGFYEHHFNTLMGHWRYSNETRVGNLVRSRHKPRPEYGGPMCQVRYGNRRQRRICSPRRPHHHLWLCKAAYRVKWFFARTHSIQRHRPYHWRYEIKKLKAKPKQ